LNQLTDDEIKSIRSICVSGPNLVTDHVQIMMRSNIGRQRSNHSIEHEWKPGLESAETLLNSDNGRKNLRRHFTDLVRNESEC